MIFLLLPCILGRMYLTRSVREIQCRDRKFKKGLIHNLSLTALFSFSHCGTFFIFLFSSFFKIRPCSNFCVYRPKFAHFEGFLMP